MIDQIPAGDWTAIVAVIAANALAIWQNNFALGKQTRRLHKMFTRSRRDTHRDLEAIRLRVAAVERKVEGLLGRRATDAKTVVLTGGDPEVTHLPPSIGGPDRPSP